MSEWLAGSVSGQVTFDGVTLKYEAMGDPTNPPAILLHGFPEFWYSWRYQMPALADAGFYAIAPDQRGYNRSSKQGPFTTKRLVQDVAQFQDALGIKRCAIVGHDWGGAVAWTFAAACPERVERLVVMNGPHPRAYMDACRKGFKQIFKSWYFFFFQLPLIPEWTLRANNYMALRSMFRKLVPPQYMSDTDIDRYVGAWRQPGAMTATINWYRGLPQQMFRSRAGGSASLPKIKAPTCVIWGMDDHALDPSCNDTLDKYVENLVVHNLPGASHFVQMYDPPAVNALLIPFLKGTT